MSESNEHWSGVLAVLTALSEVDHAGGCHPSVIAHWSREACAAIESLTAERDRLLKENAELREREGWTWVKRLTKEGPIEIDPESDDLYPKENVEVLVMVQSASSTHYVPHTIRSGRGNWSWPSFGLAWRPIQPPTDAGDLS